MFENTVFKLPPNWEVNTCARCSFSVICSFHSSKEVKVLWCYTHVNLAYLNEDKPETLLFLYKANYKYYRLTLTPKWKRLQF